VLTNEIPPPQSTGQRAPETCENAAESTVPNLRPGLELTSVPRRLLFERRTFILKLRVPRSEYTMNIFYIIGVVVVVVVVAGFFGLRV
jgi:hypothetical protein